MQVDLIQQVFADMATRFADRIACQADERSLTYRELAGRAEGIAAQLQAQGLGKGSIVAILTSDPFQLIESILGVLRAGAAFMPLEPSWPRRPRSAPRWPPTSSSSERGSSCRDRRACVWGDHSLVQPARSS